MKRIIKQSIAPVLILFLALSVSACGSTEKVVTKTQFKSPTILHPPPPAQLRLNDVDWKVVNKERLKELIQEADANNEDLALIALTPEGYESLSLNMQELKRYILQQKEIIAYYRETYDEIKENTEKANKEAQEEETEEEKSGGFLGLF